MVPGGGGGGGSVTWTATVCAMAVPLATADTVFVPTTLELSVPVVTPEELVGPAGCVSEFPSPVADSTTVTPLIAAPNWSFTVTVISDAPPPAAIDAGVAVTVDSVAETAGAAMTCTAALCAGAPGDTPLAATGVTSNATCAPSSAATKEYVRAVAPGIAPPLRSHRYVEVPSASPSSSVYV